MNAPAFLIAAFLMAQGPPPAPLPDLPDWVFTVEPEDENLDVLHFGDSKPTLIRFRIRIDGQGFRTAWDGALARLYNYVDANDDGLLTAAEVARPGWRQLVSSLGDDPRYRDDAGLAVVVGDPAYGPSKGGRIAVDEFRRYVRGRLGQGPLQVQAAHSADPIDQAAFNLLDQDRDGTLPAAELAPASASADSTLRRLDLDEDEVLDRAELEPNRNPLAGIFSNESGVINGDPLGGPLVALATPEARSRAARRLLARYDGIDATARDGRLTRREAGFPPATFRLADSNDDSRLDLAEVERLLADPRPDIVMDVRLAKDPDRPATLGPAADDPSPVDPRVATRPDRDLMIELDGRKVRVGPNDAVSDLRSYYDSRFEASDLDKDGSIDRAEAIKGLYFRRLVGPADRDGDDRLSRAELTLYLERQLDLGRNRASIHASEDGRPVFETIDSDADNRLGRRELREAGKRLKAAFDRDGDGRLGLDEVPATTRLRIGRGPADANRGGMDVDTYDAQPRPRTASGRPEVAWFRKMDRNRDGDVSAAEFLGPAEDFRKLDADGDGLIDESEASKGP